MIYMWFTGINYYKLAVEKDRDSIFTTITTIWKPGNQVLKSRPWLSSFYYSSQIHNYR
jgi:hypothetical protein